MYDNNFLGKNNFIWFNVVEDRNDPQKLGSLRVRCVGIHTDNKDELLWRTAQSQLIHPITSSWYFWFRFNSSLLLKAHGCLVTLDGYAMQRTNAITLPVNSAELSNASKGL